MTAFNFRSLLLAAIVLSNCITWTASRHHYAHNVHQHRTRHRRQGAGLYLPASYVIPGGEGGGPWGEWGEVSPCSRTCGGGVASQKRICLQPGPEGQCSGGDTKYFSCQTQDCPDGLSDFRAEQCAEFNDKAFRGFKYDWVPYTKAPNPCELNCMPHGERFYFRHKLQVTDGTRCNSESFDVCVNGKCQPVGCDMMLNSTAREDKCRECRGNGANCRTTDGLFDSQDLMKGYNDILLIPAGSTSIYIAEVEPSNNYLALRAKNGTYYLNGHYHIDFPRTIKIAGTLWTYDRSQQGFAAPDKLRCLGPTTEPLYLSLLLQDQNVGISYEYSVPTNSAPPTDKQYNWVHEEFTPCSATCGGGFQTRNVTCRSREELEIVDASLCDEGLKPPTNQSCSPDPCPAQWVEGPWGECSQRCGSGGVKSREVSCQKIIANGIKSVVPDKECFDLLGPKPEVFQKCNEDAPCPTWFIGHWKPCDQLCDDGKQTRQVVCYQKKNGRIDVLDDGNCTEAKPEEEQPCMLQPCDGVDWVTSSWSGCDSCTSKNRTRLVVCSTKGRQALDDKFCSYHNRPKDFEMCKEDELPACEVQWYATQWSKCSVNCGDGVQTRKVFCGMFYNDKSGEGVEMVEDAKCANLTKYKDTKPCTVPKEECPSQWFAGPWTACSETCGGGRQSRRVMCFQGDKLATDCDSSTVLDHEQFCNIGSCDPDELLWTKSTVVSDEKEEYCDDEVYDEVGLDSITSDTMMSDSPGYAEHESTLETGSGYGSSLSTDDLTTEASGFSTTDTTDSDYTTDDETGSGETSLTPDVSSSTVSKDKDGTTTTTVIPPTESPAVTPASGVTVSPKTSETGSTAEETGSTPTSITEDTGATPSSDSTGSTEETESTPTADTGSTSSDTNSTASEDSTETEASGPTKVKETGSTESIVTKEIASTSESGSTSSGETGSSDTDDTGSTTVAETGSTESSISTDAIETGSTSQTGSTSSGETVSTDTSDAGSTGTEETESTGSSSSTDAKESGSTVSTTSGESTPTGETGSTVTDKTVSGSTKAETGSTDSTVTETTGPTETTITETTGPTETTITETTGPTETTITETTGPTETTITETTGPTETTITETTGPTETTITETTGPTETTITETTGPTETSITKETSPTESTVTDTTESTSDTDSTVTETTNTGSTGTEDTSSTGTEDFASTGSTDSTTTTRAVPTDSTTTTRAVPTESKEEEPTTPSPTDSSEATESSIGTSESSVKTSTSSGVESSTGSESTSEAAESSTTSGLDGTTESGSTISAESTTESTESSSLGAESTGTESTTPSGTESTAETNKSGSTSGSESTTESGSSTGESSTVSGEITTGTESTEVSTTSSGSTTDSEGSLSTGSEESTISTYSTTEGTTISGSTEGSGSTATELSTTEGSTDTTIWTKSTVFVTTKSVCKPRRKPNCNETTFGCCPDQKRPAAGPFDEGCDKPHTCKKSTHGCCPDGLSPAQGKNNEGCPVEPCADTLFGCCASDNTTAAQGNDQDGCPPPPPPCALSKYGCCADNDTEAAGPEKEGCPETDTSTTGAFTDTTTESIETSEGSTTTAETTDVTGTTTLDPCSGFEFGCCADNETEASGPDGQGCPCNATEFGCCPDGVSPASGLENEGCPGPCSTSPHGCCQDDKTPAHGPDFEGCCLLQAFGCCPDNRKPAEGPHLEGCGCQYALNGCCPDNVTIAQGPDNQGCGCQYTQHGCCPDRHTAATGLNNEGCACNTYQFGCCADGVTTAKGPEQQGCHCRESKFGCCGDGETHATGPDATGCDCSSSRHGCCPDGRTEATGPKFLGCTDAPENKQAACSMSTDPGPCHNFTAMWYYDLAYGGCSRFWYGGCEGNGNRFATKEECEDVCVQPSPKDACKLPSVKGACDADYQRWHYNSTREQCIPFRYGGCLGNANNFDTRELCQKQCEPSSDADQCNLPIDQGSCAGNYSRWGFNSEARRCEQFIWGGCEGNSNRFSSEAACQMRCAGTQPPQCTKPQEAGNCAEKEALWSFSQSENRCLPFYYSGCGGNDNRFRSRETCEQTCPSAYVADKCTLPAETGQCSNYRERWFYDTTFKRCRQFYYGGCGGNENNFGTEAECDNSCSEMKTTTTATITTTITTARPVEPQRQPRPAEPEQRPAAPERSEFCFNPIDAGPCTNTETRYAYDSALGHCVTFQYGGCGGNRNNFPDEAYCSFYCQPMQDICQLPMLQGPCEDSLMRWFYDPTTDSCSQFTYGGCEGNDNRFESLEACEKRCKTGPAPVEPTTPTTTVIADGPSECRVPEALEDCRYGGKVWYFDPSRHECVSHANQVDGPACRYTGTFLSQEACERSCGAFRGVDVCKQSKDPGPCQSYDTKVYFDSTTGQCHEFVYGGCLGGANRFSSIEECSQVCKAEIDLCTLPPESGSCSLYVQQWYYDASRDQCNQFVYTGCSGNENRFETQRDCEARCKRPAPTTTTVATPPQQLAEPECRTPSSLAPCGNNVTVFYYDSDRRQCLMSGFGGCGHPNTFRTEEECERSCGAFRGMDVCGAHLDPGPCRGSFNKIYWDAMSGSCQPYAYGGCAGGPNRFSNVEECTSVCGDTGPAAACLQAAQPGRSCAAAPAPRYRYSAAHADCVVFAYLGCGGNDNNFRSYAHCADVCMVSRTGGDDPPNVLTQDCTPYREECEALNDCQYGMDRFTQDDGCQRCQCREDPCVRINCQSNERCVAIALRNSVTQEPVYSARCVAETNEVYDCEEYVANCSLLRCEYGIQRTRLPDGCEKCSCVQVEIDCEALKQKCDQLKCTYGTERIFGTDGCERCKCKDNPCERKSCGTGERCVIQPYMNGLDPEPKYTAECRTVVKAGACPMDDTTTNEVTCRRECKDDADCRGVGKCCRRGCSDICLVPVEQTSPHPLLTTTVAPNVPAAPLALPQQEPEVSASEGGTATLRCLFHGNPPPKITWRFGELTIDDSEGRYRLMSDGALEIVSLYRNDTGVYICVADNGLGVATQEIHLVVNDPVRMPVGIAGDENAAVTGELGRPLHVRCLAYGYPPPSVFWYRGYESVMVPYNDAVYEARGNVLLIRSLALETLGQYTCQAYNGEGKAASWVVFVRAYMPEGLFIDNELLIPRNPAVHTGPVARTQPPTTAETTTTTTTTTEAPRPLFTVPVSTHVSTPFSTLNIGADLHLTCEVDGFPEPDVHWSKDGGIIQTDGRITITGSTIVSRLTVARVSVADSGLYACHANNPYSSQSDTAQINVQQLVVPAKCTDNPFFANCDLIVRSKFCRHKYYSKFCCKSCVEAGQLDPQEAELQADQPLKKK